MLSFLANESLGVGIQEEEETEKWEHICTSLLKIAGVDEGEGVVSLEYKADEHLNTFHLAQLEMQFSHGLGDHSNPQSWEGVCRWFNPTLLQKLIVVGVESSDLCWLELEVCMAGCSGGAWSSKENISCSNVEAEANSSGSYVSIWLGSYSRLQFKDTWWELWYSCNE